MAILTMKGHVSRAKDFLNKDSIYVAIGHPEAWSSDTDEKIDDNNPPAPANTDDIIDVFGYKKVEFKSLVVQDDAGTLEYRGSKWKIVLEEDAIKEGARWVFLSTTLTYNELPTDKAYRQVGLFTGLEREDGVSTEKYVLLPEEVADPGILEVLDNRKPVFRDNDVKEQIKLIIEF